MERNMGTADRLVRGLVVAPAAIVGGIAVGVGSVLGIALLAVGGIMAATALVGFCPLYKLVGVRTCPLQRVTRG